MKTIELVKIGPETETVSEPYTDEKDTKQTRKVEKPVETVINSETFDDDPPVNAKRRYELGAELKTRDSRNGATYTHRVVEAK